VTNSRAKGKRGELAFRDLLRKYGYPEARRGQQYAGGPGSPDVVGGPPGYHFEVKNRERHDPWAAMAQAESEMGVGELPVVAMKRNGMEWLMVMRADELLHLMHMAAYAKRLMDREMAVVDKVFGGSPSPA
jgi:hypothetical protein